jgi:cytoskeletal protein CcmA (bactofilin family)
MIFQQKPSGRSMSNAELNRAAAEVSSSAHDEVETIVGPSVNVEGDFASEGNIIVKGSVAGSVHTSRNLSVEPGARILANVKAGSARIAGEVKGNIKVKDSLELSGTAKVLGDVEAKILVIEAGALICGKVWMPGLESEVKAVRIARAPARKIEEPVSQPAAD